MGGDVVNGDSAPLHLSKTDSPMQRLHDIVSHNAGKVESHLEDKEDCQINEDDLEESVESVQTQQAFHRLQMLHRYHRFMLVSLMEPFQHVRKIQKYKRRLGMHQDGANCSGKIWFFVEENVDVEILYDTAQQVTLKLFLQKHNRYLITTMVYAKCDEVERMPLWDSIYQLVGSYDMPWLVGGDFNVVMNKEEKIGGVPVVPQNFEDFAFCINSCDLFETCLKGSPFTWWNGRAGDDCIFERLDRIFFNSRFQQWFGHIVVEHLSKTESDHAPLLITSGEEVQTFIKPFKFLKFWTEHKDFLDIVKLNWSVESVGNPFFLVFKQKIKIVKRALSAWSRLAFEDIFKQLIIREDIVRIKEQLFEEDPSAENRIVLQLAQAEMKKRKRLEVNRIQISNGEWIEDKEQLVAEAVNFFQQQFSQEEEALDFGMLKHIPQMLSSESNDLLCALPSPKEVKNVIFELKGETTCGPDGLSGTFFHLCWDIVGMDVFRMVQAFYEGHTLPKSLTNTNLVLIPKKSEVHTFGDL
ncbi:uncharacterized protein LOC132630501 [Lycium barbarum]|uniref:uncharacterized protein LOC132630501 n=1 Tax=Lycium barbarum TaxID=112863 RepID=UPI00293F1665|nr:uncharacterized protein LOC132630501 [Lycium barbarum]